jgi:hypothetical protein
MGNVLQKATDAKAELGGKKAQYKVDENKSEFMKLKDVIAETTGAPVLGPFICLAFHRVVALCAFIFFVYTIQEIAPTFYEKRSFATVEFQTVRSTQHCPEPIARIPRACHLHLHRGLIVLSLLCR